MSFNVAVTLQKGGVGKTTSTVNITAALADQGHDVLLVDLDPQGYATKSLGHRDAYTVNDDSLYDILVEARKFEELPSLVVEHDTFDVLPAHIKMFELERELFFESRTQERLGMAFAKSGLGADYDFVVIDTPPNLGPLTDNALMAARHAIFPAQAQASSRDALEMLFDQIETLELEYETTIAMVGAIVNQIERSGMDAEMVEWFEDIFGDAVWKIPKRVALRYAWDSQETIFSYDPEGHEEDVVEDLRERYRTIATALEREREGLRADMEAADV